MLPTLDEVLALPAFVAADHEVLVGRAGDVVVRWVHSSEVYEMGGLLAGGELLLTTGLGLEGRSEDQIARYVDRIADSGCAAVAFEVGRSFLEIPPVMVRIARERGLGLVVLREVVPFHRMVEEFHELLVRRKVGAPRGSEPAWQELIGLVAAGQGIQTLLNATARLAGCPVGVVDLDGRGLHRSAEVGLPPRPTASFHVEVRAGAQRLGRLEVHGAETTRRRAVAERAALAVAIQLGPATRQGSLPSWGQSIVTDLAAGELLSDGELADRCRAADWPLLPGTHLLVMCVDVEARTPPAQLLPAVQDAARAELGPCLVGTVEHGVIVVARGWTTPARARWRSVGERVLAALRAKGHGPAVRTVGLADPVAEPGDAARAVARARQVTHLARRSGVRGRVLAPSDMAAYGFLATHADAAQLAGFVEGVLGALFEHESRTGARLVETVEALLRSGMSKARAADVLGIRRQSVYARVERAEDLLGARLDDPDVQLAVGMALVAWRLRTGGWLDPGGRPARLAGKRG